MCTLKAGEGRQPSLLAEFQASERPCLKEMDTIQGMTPEAVLCTSASIHIQLSSDLAGPGAIAGFSEAATQGPHLALCMNKLVQCQFRLLLPVYPRWAPGMTTHSIAPYADYRLLLGVSWGDGTVSLP